MWSTAFVRTTRSARHISSRVLSWLKGPSGGSALCQVFVSPKRSDIHTIHEAVIPDTDSPSTSTARSRTFTTTFALHETSRIVWPFGRTVPTFKRVALIKTCRKLEYASIEDRWNRDPAYQPRLGGDGFTLNDIRVWDKIGSHLVKTKRNATCLFTCIRESSPEK